MPRYIVYGTRDISVAASLFAHCPRAVIIKFDEDDSVVAILPSGAEEILSKNGLRLIEIDTRPDSTIPRLFFVRKSPDCPRETSADITEILRRRFGARPARKDVFEIPVPAISSDPSFEYEGRFKIIEAISDLLRQLNISAEIGITYP